MSISFQPEEIERLRARLRKMSDAELQQFGKAIRFMCRDENPRETFLTQLKEAQDEWWRRHPKVAK